jgi:hypothetical protein
MRGCRVRFLGLAFGLERSHCAMLGHWGGYRLLVGRLGRIVGDGRAPRWIGFATGLVNTGGTKSGILDPIPLFSYGR